VVETGHYIDFQTACDYTVMRDEEVHPLPQNAEEDAKISRRQQRTMKGLGWRCSVSESIKGW